MFTINSDLFFEVAERLGNEACVREVDAFNSPVYTLAIREVSAGRFEFCFPVEKCDDYFVVTRDTDVSLFGDDYYENETSIDVESFDSLCNDFVRDVNIFWLENGYIDVFTSSDDYDKIFPIVKCFVTDFIEEIPAFDLDSIENGCFSLGVSSFWYRGTKVYRLFLDSYYSDFSIGAWLEDVINEDSDVSIEKLADEFTKSILSYFSEK